MAEYAFNEALSLKLNVNNATDKLYADSLYRGFYAPGAPRTVQATFKAVF
jgi:catecholate siderophore receptor